MNSTTPVPPRPMGCVSRVFVWTMIVLIPLFTVAIGLYFVADGLSGRATLATGPVGTFTATEKSCGGRGGCHLEGTFTSDDGTISRQGVDLRDAAHVGSGDPLPSPIDGVRLDADARRPAAYTPDYSWGWAVVKGAGFAVLGPVMAVGLAVGTMRYQARARAAHGRAR
ncbi:hypothetical protein [Nocardiopsis aegyptia]|uniref:Uncharacterized protein n=1 Tax=Nocardiopsis aegyptia TaxID=220378 RepID=A0A7Z0J7Z6_9ACTN|nr:hypothetical protein [Nocardiopsis aegyptia]NYJ32553.1 hypothetical protein [Nocardiopsis aegyptia]